MTPVLGYWKIRGLPYYIDGDLKLTETVAIIKYIAEKHNMGGTTEESRARLMMVNGKLNDIRNAFVRICYNKDFEKLKEGFLENLPASLKQMEAFLQKNKWFSGENPDYPDFNAYDLFDTLRTFQQNCLDQYPKIIQFLENFSQLPKVRDYIKSDKYIKWPFNNKIALWGGDC